MNWTWLKAVGQAFATGAVVSVAAMATTMAADGFTLDETRVLGAVAISGGLSGLALLFKQPPRDPERRDRETDKEG